MSTNTADCIGVIGASGTGKGVYCKALLSGLVGRRPVAIWSPLEATDRYAELFGGAIVRTVPELCSRMKARAPVVVFVPADDHKTIAAQFSFFCRVVWAVKRCAALVEELSRVTSASYAPTAWKNLSTAGRHQGLTVIATAQRPEQIDKDFLGNCTEVRAYRVNNRASAANLAGNLLEPAETFLQLPDLHYVHRFIRERRNVRGVQPLPGQAPAPTKKSPRPRARATP